MASKMGFKNINIFDFDTIAEHNLSTGLFENSGLNELKENHMKNQMIKYGDPKIKIKTKGMFLSQTLSKNVWVCPDNMTVRKMVYQKWKSHPDRNFLIDGRMGSLGMQIVTMTKTQDNYIDYWFEDNTIIDEPCTMKHTIFTANIAAGIMLSQFFLVLQKYPYYQSISYELISQILTKNGYISS